MKLIYKLKVIFGVNCEVECICNRKIEKSLVIVFLNKNLMRFIEKLVWIFNGEKSF